MQYWDPLMQPEHLIETVTDEEAALALYLAGALPDAERMEFERHLAGCDRCLAEAAELGSVTSALGQFSDVAAILALDEPALPAPVAVRSPGSRRSSRPKTARIDSTRPARSLRRYLVYVTSAVAVLVLAGFGALLLRDSDANQAGAGVVVA